MIVCIFEHRFSADGNLMTDSPWAKVVYGDELQRSVEDPPRYASAKL
jgi:hypothetical protein